VDAVTNFFAHLCSQGRCFVLDGEALPICQRCFGLYAGAAVTGAWLLLAGGWRCGLPNRAAGWVQGIALFAAMLGGLHAIDAGPAWRLTCGLWTGHVAALWLTGAGVQLAQVALPDVRLMRAWRRPQNVQLLAACPILAAAAWIFATRVETGWLACTVVACVGAAFLVVAAFWTIVCLGLWALAKGRTALIQNWSARADPARRNIQKQP
jgi:hypothetical protein